VWQLSMEIRDGTLAAKLLRPIHPIIALAADHISAVPMRALVITPVVAILMATGWDRLLRHDLVLAAIFVASLAGAWLLIFFTMVMMGSLSFFLESALGIFELWLGVHAILSGYLVPLEALPQWVRRAADVLPFRFMLGFPVETLVGLLSRQQALVGLAAQWGYVALAGALALLVWRTGLRRFSAFGG
jgi:ABC-2 type transport system permease protein